MEDPLVWPNELGIVQFPSWCLVWIIVPGIESNIPVSARR